MAIFSSNDIFLRDGRPVAIPPSYRTSMIACLFTAVVGMSLAALSGAFSVDAIGAFAAVLIEKSFGAGLFMSLVLFLVYALARTPRHESVLRSLPRRFERNDLRRIAVGAALLVSILIANGTYSLIKRLMPLIAPFSWDETLADLDKTLHFGFAPWRILHAVVPDFLYPAIEINYLLGWGVYCMGLLVFVCFAPGADRSRTRYVVTYLFGFIGIGNLLAFAFLSAGPIFYDKVTGDLARFAELSRFIEAGAGNPVPVVEVRDFLWSAYVNSAPGIGTGISAFPSVHLAMVTFGFWLIFEQNRGLGFLALGYLVSIFVSSVYLGWHYALDGYVSIAVMTGFHFAARTVERRFTRSISVSALPEEPEAQAAFA